MIADIAIGSYLAFGMLVNAAFALIYAFPEAGAGLPQHEFLLRHGPSLFAQGQILASFIVLLCILRLGKIVEAARRLLAVAALTLAAELSSVFTGFPFGRDAYGSLLGWKILGAVPFLIPLSWIAIAVPAHAVAARAFPEKTWARRLFGAALMLSWDMSVDPLMVNTYAFWTWKRPGFYYGIPATNFAGWFGVGLAAMAILDGRRRDSTEDARLFAQFVLSLAMTLGMALLAGMPWAALITGAGAAAAVIVFRSGRSPASADVEAGGPAELRHGDPSAFLEPNPLR